MSHSLQFSRSHLTVYEPFQTMSYHFSKYLGYSETYGRSGKNQTAAFCCDCIPTLSPLSGLSACRPHSGECASVCVAVAVQRQRRKEQLTKALLCCHARCLCELLFNNSIDRLQVAARLALPLIHLCKYREMQTWCIKSCIKFLEQPLPKSRLKLFRPPKTRIKSPAASVDTSPGTVTPLPFVLTLQGS